MPAVSAQVETARYFVRNWEWRAGCSVCLRTITQLNHHGFVGVWGFVSSEAARSSTPWPCERRTWSVLNDLVTRCRMRQSAGTQSPVRSSTMSPGTNSAAATADVGATMCAGHGRFGSTREGALLVRLRAIVVRPSPDDGGVVWLELLERLDGRLCAALLEDADARVEDEDDENHTRLHELM